MPIFLRLDSRLTSNWTYSKMNLLISFWNYFISLCSFSQLKHHIKKLPLPEKSQVVQMTLSLISNPHAINPGHCFLDFVWIPPLFSILITITFCRGLNISHLCYCNDFLTCLLTISTCSSYHLSRYWSIKKKCKPNLSEKLPKITHCLHGEL